LSSNGIIITKNQVNLEKPIKELGIYNISISLHPEISSEITINVARTDEEAQLQEKGSEPSTSKLSESEENELGIDKMFDDESMASKINEDSIDGTSKETVEELKEFSEKDEKN
jgi:Ribosomal protein L9